MENLRGVRLSKEQAEMILGRRVTVTVDRPRGSVHPAYRDTVYRLNYGYVSDLTGGDGEPQDAYILGVDEPVATFTGKVVAVILRENDVEDKLVVSPDDRVYNQAEIMAAVHFQERYFRTTVVCLYEKSCGAIVYRRVNNVTEYLLLFQRGSRTWSFPKGHAEPWETEEQTACREVREETGLSVTLAPGFRESVSYPLSRQRTKFVHLYLAQAAGEVVIRQEEIERFAWVSSDEAIRLLPGAGYEAVLKRAEALILSR